MIVVRVFILSNPAALMNNPISFFRISPAYFLAICLGTQCYIWRWLQNELEAEIGRTRSATLTIRCITAVRVLPAPGCAVLIFKGVLFWSKLVSISQIVGDLRDRYNQTMFCLPERNMWVSQGRLEINRNSRSSVPPWKSSNQAKNSNIYAFSGVTAVPE